MIRSRTNRRRGQATIELVFFLPMLVALLSIVFLAASLTLSRSQASIGARNKAFGGRHEPWKPSGDYTVSRLPVPGTSYAGLILGPRPRQRADGGLLHAEETRDVDVRFGPLKQLAKDVTTEHYVLGGSWDKQEIEFRRHPRLMLTEKSAYFGIGIPLNGFGNLLGFGSGGGGAGSAIASANQAISDARNQLNGVINDLRNQLNSVRNALNAERAKDPPDENRIRELEQREQELIQQIKEARDAKDQIGLDLPTDVSSGSQPPPNPPTPSNRPSPPENTNGDDEESTAEQIGHAIADVLGLVPGAGEYVDAAHALWYFSEGRDLEGALTALSIAPIVGDALGKGTKYSMKLILKGGEAAKGFIRAIDKLGGLKAVEKIFDTLPGKYGERARKAFQKFYARVLREQRKWPGGDPSKAPGGFEWRGKPGSTPGSPQGNYYNPKTGESLRPDLNHPEPIGPHWDYRDAAGEWWRVLPNGQMTPK